MGRAGQAHARRSAAGSCRRLSPLLPPGCATASWVDRPPATVPSRRRTDAGAQPATWLPVFTRCQRSAARRRLIAASLHSCQSSTHRREASADARLDLAPSLHNIPPVCGLIALAPPHAATLHTCRSSARRQEAKGSFRIRTSPSLRKLLSDSRRSFMRSQHLPRLTTTADKVSFGTGAREKHCETHLTQTERS